jgi:hypothetical protein
MIKGKTELLTNFNFFKILTVENVVERNAKSMQFFFLENC